MPSRPPPAEAPLAALASVLLDLALAAVLLAWAAHRIAPPQDLPWTPLRLDQPVGLATGAKLARLRIAPGVCPAWLRDNGVAFTPAPLTGRAPGCAAPGAVRLAASETRLSPAAPVMDCPLAAAYLVWERAALRRPGARLTAVEHVGTYACRPIAGRRALSQHARARAIDVTALRWSDGTRAAVARDWRGAGAASRRLHAARDRACGLFAGVLSPDYNAAHRTHLHLDAGPYGLCG